MASILKIPFILTAAACFHISMTPPNPTPSSQELLTPKAGEKMLIMFGGPAVPKGICWITSLVEAAVILARKNPSLPLTATILRYFVPGGLRSAALIRITPTFISGCLVTVVGTALRYWCYRTLGRLFTFQLSIRHDHQLVTSGPYSVVRHPSYTGVILVALGIQFCLFSPGSWLRESGILKTLVGKCFAGAWSGLCIGAYSIVLARIPKEDEMMKDRFGLQWTEWAARVPYRIFPGIY